MIWRSTALALALLCGACAAATSSASPRASVDGRIPSISTPLAGATTTTVPLDTNGITKVEIAIVHDASQSPAIHATLEDASSLGTFVKAVQARTIGAPAPGTDSRYACSLGPTATYTINVVQGSGGYTVTEQICNGGLLSGELSGDVRAFLGDIDGLAHTE